MAREPSSSKAAGSIQRAIIIVVDSMGIGELPDAGRYGDLGSNTLANTASFVGGLDLPNLAALGLGNICDIRGIDPAQPPMASYGKMAERSAGKDSTTGHWELMGLYLTEPFPTYPSGFPTELMEAFETAIDRSAIGNKPASGTEIVKELGQEHMKTGSPIVYTSADSVFQIAAHEAVIAPDELYRICRVARRILTGKHNVARVIARPFNGKPGSFMRTERRKDFSLEPPGKTILDFALENKIPVKGIGKIGELFSFRGLTSSVHTDNNMHGMDKLIDSLRADPEGIIFINLVDFDMLWGHRNDAPGYAKGLADFDLRLKEVLEMLGKQDVLIITADHGCDPTTPSTDHSREYVPILAYGKSLAAVDLGTRQTFADVGKTIAGLLHFDAPVHGKSFALDLLKKGIERDGI